MQGTCSSIPPWKGMCVILYSAGHGFTPAGRPGGKRRQQAGQAAAFCSPIDRRLPISEWGRDAKKQGAAGAEPWYEAARLLVVSWEEAEDAAVAFLKMSGMSASEPHHSGSITWPEAVRASMASFWAKVPDDYPRLQHLKVGISRVRGRQGVSHT